MKKEFKTLHYLVALLKKYDINNIVASPGRQNSYINVIMQQDKFFNTYSVIDERSAGYVALGISFETQRPTVITCTGATASRNFLSSMTEAYYKKIPIVAITFYTPSSNGLNLSAQYVDRSVTQNDVKYVTANLVETNSEVDLINNLLAINNALYSAVYKNEPVHINCPSSLEDEVINYDLPDDIWSLKMYTNNFSHLKEELENKDTAIFIGEHQAFSKETEQAISDFARSWNVPVLCDHTSQYHGDNKILVSKAYFMQRNLSNCPEIIIDLGGISGEYCLSWFFSKAKLWRISPDGKLKARLSRPIAKLFYTDEESFFTALKNDNYKTSKFYTVLSETVRKLQLPELPLCAAFIAQNFAQHIPVSSSLHLGILNSLRNFNFFDIDKTIKVNCNVGGFGIDGPVSTAIGQSLVNPDKKIFVMLGDLAFFYDMNALGIRHINNNLRILLINNNCGVEFRLNESLEKNIGSNINNLIGAAGHNSGGAKGWAESCGFKYMAADTKEMFASQIDAFCNNDFDQPLLFEVFTTIDDEQKGLDLMRSFNRNSFEEGAIKTYKLMKKGLK